MPCKVDLIQKEPLYQGFFRLERVSFRHERFAGGMSAALDREVLSRADIVAVLPYDPGLGEVILIEQFRVGPYLAGKPAWLAEIVAGLIEPGESAEEAAARETREEIGTDLIGLSRIGTYFLAPHQSPDQVQLFLGKVNAALACSHAGLAVEGEDIRVRRISYSQAISLAAAGDIQSHWTLIALPWLECSRSRQLENPA